MSVEKIISDWKKNKFSTVYWLHGDEDYYIDEVIKFAEHAILSESEAEFNLSIFYGKDALWSDVVNACMRYPMFSEKQIVLLKEAQHMKDIEKLDNYIENPLPSTIFIVAYKEKKFDKRKAFFKVLEKNAVILVSEKLKDEKVAEWIDNYVKERGISMNAKSIALLFDHLGNDLSKIINEIDKLLINVGINKTISENDIEKYTGINKEYNVFELSAAIAKKDFAKAVKIISYFEANPKATPIQQILPALYPGISKVYAAFGINQQEALKQHFYFNPVALQQGTEMMRNYGFNGVQKLLLLLHEYNLKSIGVNNSGTPDASLLKEMVFKMMSN